MIEIKNRYTGEVIYSGDGDTIRQVVEAAVAARADLRGANLRGANLSGADLSGADLSGFSDVIVPSLHRRMLAAIESGGQLEMSTWHACETTHCRAGWAIHLAGPAGRVLERCVGSSLAGAIIHLVSCPQLECKVPDFYASNDDAMADIKRLAEMEPEIATHEGAGAAS